jgi:hypothetical protein
MDISKTLPEIVLAELAEEGATVDPSAAAEARKEHRGALAGVRRIFDES